MMDMDDREWQKWLTWANPAMGKHYGELLDATAALTASEARLRQAEELLRRCRNDPGTVFTDLDARTYMQLVDDVDAFLAASEPRQGAQSDAGGDA